MTQPRSVATIVLLPPEREQDLLELAQEWTSAWLIRSALWVKTSDITPDTGPLPEAPPRVSAMVLGRNGSVCVDLFEELSRREFHLVRFIAVRSVEYGSTANDQLDTAVEILKDHLKVSKPTSTSLQFINVIVAPTRQAGASAGQLIEAGWNVNVIASPEDRRSPNSFDVFTRHSEQGTWAGFVLAHTVTAAGLWATIEVGPYDESEFDGFMEGTHVQRVAVRGVLTGALVVNVARQAMTLAAQDESPLTDPLLAIDEQDLRVMAPEDEARAISEAVDYTLRLGGGQLAYRRLPNPPVIERTRLGLMAQIEDVSRFGADKIKETPHWVSRFFRRKVSRKATAELHGDEGDARVNTQGILDWDDAELSDAVTEINRQREVVVAELDAPVTARRHDIDGPLFESVRQSCFALLDGSEFPEGFVLRGVQALGNAAPVVASVSRVIPDWARSWAPSEAVEGALGSFAQTQGEPEHWLDVHFASAWDDELSRRRDRLATREGELRRRLGELQSKAQRNAELLEEAALTCDAMRDEVSWLEEDLAAHQADSLDDASPTSAGAQPFADLKSDQLSLLEPSDSRQTLPEPPNPDGNADQTSTTEVESESEPTPPSATEEPPDLHSPQHDRPDPVMERLRDSLRQLRADLAAASQDESMLRREREQLRTREARTAAALEGVDKQVSLVKEARDSLRTWVSSRSESFAWRLLVKLAQERQAAASDFDMLRAAAKTPIDPPAQHPSQMRDRFMRRAVISLAVVALAWVAVVVLKFSVPALAQIAPAVNPIAWPVWLSALVALGTFIVVWVLFLVTYYRENSQSRFQLRRASAHVDHLSRTSLAAREERQRLDSLHRQVPDYLKYLSETIHRPWTATSNTTGSAAQESTHQLDTPETLVFGAARPRTELLPSFMRLAESTPGAGGDREMALVRDTVRSLLHRGWRYGVLRDLLAAVEQAESLPQGTFDPTRLDRDPRLRSALMAALDRSDARLIAGRGQLRVLAERIQKQIMDQIHPPVSDLALDPLRDLQVDEDLLGEADWRVKEWDDFLGEALSLPSQWSTLAFSLAGNPEGIEDVKALGYGPERIADLKDDSVTFIGMGEKSTRPVELVVRIDRTQTSRGPGAFHVFSGTHPFDPMSITNDRATEHANQGSNESPVHAPRVLGQDYLA
jgi:hypothetical protein